MRIEQLVRTIFASKCTALSSRVSWAKVDRLFDEHGGEAPPGLEDAVRSALKIRKIITAFRYGCLRSREDGPLYHYIEAWYVELYVPDRCMDHYPETLERRNPYAAFKLKNPGLSKWYKQLDFLLEDVPRVMQSTRFQLPISPDDISDMVARGLQPGGSLCHLISKSRYLTHDENVAIAVMDARLWLCHSPLPVSIGSDVSYASLRKKETLPSSSSPPSSPSDALPSVFHVLLRERTVAKHWSLSLHADLELHHLSPSQFGDGDAYWAHMARVRYPHLKGKSILLSDYISRLVCRGKIEEGILCDLDGWSKNETESMYILLAKFVHRMTPSMHRELKARLEREEEEDLD